MIAEMMQDLRAEYERREGEAYTRGREDMRRLVLSFIAHGCGGERCTVTPCACALDTLIRLAAP